MPRELFDVNCTLLAETDKAIHIDDGTKKAWLPKSQIEYEKERDGTYTVTLPVWLATEKGLV